MVDAVSAGHRWGLTLVVNVNYFVAVDEGVVGVRLLAVHELAVARHSSGC